MYLNGVFESVPFHAECSDVFYKREFNVANSLKSSYAEEFFARNSITSIENTQSEVSDGFIATDKAQSETSDRFAATDKVQSEASDGFTAFNKVLSEPSDTSTATDKVLSEASDVSTATNNILSETSDPSAQHCAEKIHRIKTTAAHVAATLSYQRRFTMKEIQTLPLTSMNNAAHFLFVSNMAERAEKDSAVSEKCKAQVAALRSAVTAEDENLKISAKSLTTDKIVAADRLRDQLYAGYKKAVAGYTNFPMEGMAEAAKVLNQHIKDYKIDVQAQLDKETGLLVNFIQDLEGKFAEQVKTLSLGAFVEKLKAANEDVRSLTSQRTDERSAKTAGALKAARTASDEAYKMLVLHVNAHALLEGEADYAAFIDYANTEIAHFKQEVLGGKKGKAKVDAGADDSGDDA